MDYNNDKLKWNAYQFSDPFAIGSFFVLNLRTKRLCLPYCDTELTSVKTDIKFIDSSSLPALQSAPSFIPCPSCNPLHYQLDINMLVLCVETVNRMINFRASLPDLKFSKNDYDHYNLVNLACRHLAFAANVNYHHLNEKKKKRGGVLGFKELALKSKLSPWHFHRVFKSITGLTPKNYGDKCWNFFKKEDEKIKSKKTERCNANATEVEIKQEPSTIESNEAFYQEFSPASVKLEKIDDTTNQDSTSSDLQFKNTTFKNENADNYVDNNDLTFANINKDSNDFMKQDSFKTMYSEQEMIPNMSNTPNTDIPELNSEFTQASTAAIDEFPLNAEFNFNKNLPMNSSRTVMNNDNFNNSNNFSQDINFNYPLKMNSYNFDFINTNSNFAYPSPLTSSSSNNSEINEDSLLPRKRVKINNDDTAINTQNINNNNKSLDFELLLNSNHIRSMTETDLNIFNNQFFDINKGDNNKIDFQSTNDFDINLITIEDFDFNQI